MSPTLYETKLILVVLCIGLTLIHYSSQGKDEKTDGNPVINILAKVLPCLIEDVSDEEGSDKGVIKVVSTKPKNETNKKNVSKVSPYMGPNLK